MDVSEQVSTVRHCPGCRGYTHSWAQGCRGIPLSAGLDEELSVPDLVPQLRFTDRLRVLFGLPVLLGMRLAPPEEMSGLYGWPDEVSRFTDGPPWDAG